MKIPSIQSFGRNLRHLLGTSHIHSKRDTIASAVKKKLQNETITPKSVTALRDVFNRMAYSSTAAAHNPTASCDRNRSVAEIGRQIESAGSKILSARNLGADARSRLQGMLAEFAIKNHEAEEHWCVQFWESRDPSRAAMSQTGKARDAQEALGYTPGASQRSIAGQFIDLAIDNSSCRYRLGKLEADFFGIYMIPHKAAESESTLTPSDFPDPSELADFIGLDHAQEKLETAGRWITNMDEGEQKQALLNRMNMLSLALTRSQQVLRSEEQRLAAIANGSDEHLGERSAIRMWLGMPPLGHADSDSIIGGSLLEDDAPYAYSASASASNPNTYIDISDTAPALAQAFARLYKSATCTPKDLADLRLQFQNMTGIPELPIGGRKEYASTDFPAPATLREFTDVMELDDQLRAIKDEIEQINADDTRTALLDLQQSLRKTVKQAETYWDDALERLAKLEPRTRAQDEEYANAKFWLGVEQLPVLHELDAQDTVPTVIAPPPSSSGSGSVDENHPYRFQGYLDKLAAKYQPSIEAPHNSLPTAPRFSQLEDGFPAVDRTVVEDVSAEKQQARDRFREAKAFMKI